MQKPASYPAICLLAFTLAMLPGCASLSGQNENESSAPDTESPQQQASDVVTPEARYGDFEPDVLYQLLAAEIAAQRGHYNITLANYLQAARQSRDVGVVTRAMRIAQSLNVDQALQEMAALWLELEPENLQPHRIATIQAIKNGDLKTALDHMETIMNQGEDADFDSLAAMAAGLPESQQKELLELYRQLAERHPDSAEIDYSIALLLKITGEPEQALARVDNLLERQPDFQPAIVLRGDLLYQTGQPGQALDYLTTHTRRFPENRPMGTLYARMLVSEGELQAAQDEFHRILERYPDDDNLRLSHALVALDNDQPELARSELERLLERGRHSNQASYYLGRLEEDAGNADDAIDYYHSVSQGDLFFPALARASALQADTGRLDDALAHLQRLRDQRPQQAERLWLLETNLLLEQDMPEPALTTVNQALTRFPANVELRYARAMLLDSEGKTDRAIQDLEAILEQQPDNAVTLNALGYILTTSTDRLEEARGYIEEALRLDPDNPAILDSLGWVLFRQGDTEGALHYLSQAWESYPDPEVAAHYGEALWVTGNREQARLIWEQGLEQAPDHGILRETIDRLTAGSDE
ncbi:tetratricopeptide repeat protein [Marinobacter oulmenensis]|uniref:Tetratricopeptide (TPR) repeat protein n=1 Tax=Marinobacter oulmenensis TaxID=643747 RepID=A0A840UEV6_9GAMM|nr:tetratricopeptide repeat protein [Marinobacter oulmenensis]MBB5322733.1 tetratricopeptide (TPR) repeat protein [Marinobacter oulmenensis]